MRKPKPYTAKAKVLELMNEAKKNAGEIEVGAEISTKDGRPLPQNSISMYLTSMGREFFSPGDRFYFRNCRKTGKRFVGYMFEGDGKKKTEFAVPEKLIDDTQSSINTITPMVSYVQYTGRVKRGAVTEASDTINPKIHGSVPDDAGLIHLGDDYDDMMTKLSSGR